MWQIKEKLIYLENSLLVRLQNEANKKLMFSLFLERGLKFLAILTNAKYSEVNKFSTYFYNKHECAVYVIKTKKKAISRLMNGDIFKLYYFYLLQKVTQGNK